MVITLKAFSFSSEFGFVEPEFTAVEQSTDHDIQLAYFSGAGGGFDINIVIDHVTTCKQLSTVKITLNDSHAFSSQRCCY